MSNTNNNLQTQTSSVLHNDTVSSCSTSKVQEKTQLSKEQCMKSLRAIQSQFKFLIDTLQDFGTMPIFKRTFAQDVDLLEQHLTKEIIFSDACKDYLTKLQTSLKMLSIKNHRARTELEVHDDSSRSRNDTDADDADIIRFGKKEDVGLDELGEGGKEVVSKIGEFGKDLGSELFGDRRGVCDCRVEAVTFIPYTLAINFPITVQNDVFPNHPTANLEDAFSSNFPNYVPPASPDYIPTSPGKTYSKGLLSPMQLFTSTPSQPQALKIGETSRKSAIKRHEEQIQGLGKGTIIIQRDFDALAAELQQAHTQITKLQIKQIGCNHKISLARYRIAELGEVINDMETRHQEDIEKLMNSIIELQNRIQ
ncbi:hypothetical protein Tco_0115653 [Tanacetum coccineum]